MDVKFPDVEVQLSERDGNAFMIVGSVRRALRGVASPEQVEEFASEAMSGDYDHVLQTCFRWVTVL